MEGVTGKRAPQTSPDGSRAARQQRLDDVRTTDDTLWDSYLPKSNGLRKRADVVLIVENTSLIAHRDVLCVQSVVFREMFDELPAEASSSPSRERVEIRTPFDNLTLDAVLPLLQYIYSQRPEVFVMRARLGTALHLAQLADQFDIPYLRSLCDARATTLVKENMLKLGGEGGDGGVLMYASLATEYKMPRLLEYCDVAIANRFTTVLRNPKLLQLPLQSWQLIACCLEHKFQKYDEILRKKVRTAKNRNDSVADKLSYHQVSSLMIDAQSECKPADLEVVKEWAAGILRGSDSARQVYRAIFDDHSRQSGADEGSGSK